MSKWSRGAEPLEEDVDRALELVADRAHEGRELGHVGRLEERVAGVRGERAEHVGAQHRHHHRAVAARGLAGQAAAVAVGGRRVARVDELDDLVAEVVHVAPGAGRVEELRAAVARPGVDEHDDRVRAGARGEQRVEGLDHRRLERVAREPHVELARVALDHVDRGQRARVVALDAGRAVDVERAAGRVAERVVGEHVGLDDEPVERPVHRPLPGSAGGALDLAQAHAAPAARSGSGAKNGVET